MNGCERISAALTGEKTDKVPVMLHNFMNPAREYGIMKIRNVCCIFTL